MNQPSDHPAALPPEGLGEGAAGPAGIPPQAADRAILREEVEVWINEGGAGDEPPP